MNNRTVFYNGITLAVPASKGVVVCAECGAQVYPEVETYDHGHCVMGRV